MLTAYQIVLDPADFLIGHYGQLAISVLTPGIDGLVFVIIDKNHSTGTLVSLPSIEHVSCCSEIQFIEWSILTH